MGDLTKCFCAFDCSHHKEGERCGKPVDQPVTVMQLLPNGRYSEPYKMGMCEECWQHHTNKYPGAYPSH
jgi:hypothetical protein